MTESTEALRVSAIIPTYNRAAYLPDALESIFGQTSPPAEVIVVDDGSTDDTPAVLERLKLPIRYYRQANTGVAAARSKGVELATGDLIAWLDSDDTWASTFLEETTSALRESPDLAGVYTGVTFVDENGDIMSSAVRVVSPDAFYTALIEDCFIATPAIVLKRACYVEAGDFDSRFRISEDYDMWLRIARRHRIAGLAKPLVCYRQHRTNTVSNLNALATARIALAEKHFGPMPVVVAEAGEEARYAWAFALRFSGLRRLEAGDGDAGWADLAHAAGLYPPILDRLDTFYELACQHQSLGQRGALSPADLPASEAELIGGMQAIFRHAPPEVLSHRSQAAGNAYLALGMLADQSGDYRSAARYLAQALRSDRNLRSDPLVWRRLVKVTAGRPAIRLRGGSGRRNGAASR